MEKYKPSKEELEIVKKHNLYAGENHLGGYLRRNKEFPHGDPETWFPHLWKWVYDELDVYAIDKVIVEESWDKKLLQRIKKFFTIEVKKSVSLSKLQDKEK